MTTLSYKKIAIICIYAYDLHVLNAHRFTSFAIYQSN